MLLNSNQSHVSSWVRLDPIEKFRQINSSVESSEKWKVITQNVSNLNLYISSNRVNTESMKSNRMKLYSFRRSKSLIDSDRSSKSNLSSKLVINVHKAEESDYKSNQLMKIFNRQNVDIMNVNPINIVKNSQLLNPSTEYINQLKFKLEEKFKNSINLNQQNENIMREQDFRTVYGHITSPKGGSFGEI